MSNQNLHAMKKAISELRSITSHPFDKNKENAKLLDQMETIIINIENKLQLQSSGLTKHKVHKQ